MWKIILCNACLWDRPALCGKNVALIFFVNYWHGWHQHWLTCIIVHGALKNPNPVASQVQEMLTVGNQPMQSTFSLKATSLPSSHPCPADRNSLCWPLFTATQIWLANCWTCHSVHYIEVTSEANVQGFESTHSASYLPHRMSGNISHLSWSSLHLSCGYQAVGCTHRWFSRQSPNCVCWCKPCMIKYYCAWHFHISLWPGLDFRHYIIV